MIVGVDFGAPQRARDQRRKIIAIAAHSMGWRSYRIDATSMNTRLLADAPPGWTAKDLADELSDATVPTLSALTTGTEHTRGRPVALMSMTSEAPARADPGKKDGAITSCFSSSHEAEKPEAGLATCRDAKERTVSRSVFHDPAEVVDRLAQLGLTA